MYLSFQKNKLNKEHQMDTNFEIENDEQLEYQHDPILTKLSEKEDTDIMYQNAKSLFSQYLIN